MKVSINAGGRAVEIDCPDANTTYADVADKALEVWRGTHGEKPSEGPAFGLSAQVNLANNRAQYGPASMRHGDRPVVEP